MLPTSKRYLIRAGYSANAAAYLLIGLFLGGVIGIQMFSAFLHHHMASHVVDCRHTHGPDPKDMENGNAEVDRHQRSHSFPAGQIPNTGVTEDSPLLSQPPFVARPNDSLLSPANREQARQTATTATSSPLYRPALWPRLTRQFSVLLVGKKAYCDENGPCYGLSQACGQECAKTRLRKDAS